jgi:hypothetical protein
MNDRETPAAPTFPDVSVPPGGPPGRQGGRSLGVRDILRVGALVGLVCWGAWVTQSLVDGNRDHDRFVKLQLQSLIAEYLQAQARSGNDAAAAAQATTQFMGELDKAVAALGRSGRVVLVNEAVIGGDIPDVTSAVKKAVYARVPFPEAASARPVREDMQSFMATGGPGEGRQ